MAALKKWDAIFFIVFGLVNCSHQLNFNGDSISAALLKVAPDHSFLTKRRIEKSYANFVEQQIDLTINSFIVATCTSVGIFPDPSNEANYYVCLGDATSGFLKYDFSCPPLEYFDSMNKQCLPSAVTDTTTVSLPTSSPLQCISEGIFPMPQNCKMYYRCSTTLKMFNFTCAGNSYFNEQTLKCSLIITPACEAEILKNSTVTTTTMTTALSTTPPLSTTTPPPSTTTWELSTVTSTTPPTTTPLPPTTPPTTTPLPPTTISVPSTTNLATTPMTTAASTSTTTSATPFFCSVSGTFPDPTSCKSYFRCSSTNVALKYFCPGESYFNELTNKCSLTITSRCRLLL